jgi:hypothetical protein
MQAQTEAIKKENEDSFEIEKEYRKEENMRRRTRK